MYSSWPALNFVHIWQNLGDMAVAELREGCPLLKDTVLSRCHQITDLGLAHLVKNCTMLESCHIFNCPGITAVGVATVVRSCINIKEVMVDEWKVSQRTQRRASSVIVYLCGQFPWINFSLQQCFQTRALTWLKCQSRSWLVSWIYTLIF